MKPWPMRDRSRDKLADPSLADKVHRATLRTVAKRAAMVADTPGWQRMRTQARQDRLRALDRHQQLVDTFCDQLKQRGVHVYMADTPAQAREIIASLVTAVGSRVTKSKSMTSEEIGLNAALEAAGVQVTETDLGELIVQLAHQPPSHITAPAIHLSVEDIARIFRDRLGMTLPGWVDGGERVDERTREAFAIELSLRARHVLRERFLEADVGISGANFLVAATGTVVLLENEGNIQLTTCLPRRHIVLAGIDKLVESETELGLLLRLLPVSATAQRQTCYVTLFADRHPDMHVVLLDHGRRALMQDEQQRDLLTCIRCGACMNACPVYRNVGGHAYGGAYVGPIGALLMPHLEGLEHYVELPFASSLCGACTEACPVAIPLHDRLLQLRARAHEQGLIRDLRWTLRASGKLMQSPRRLQAATDLYGLARAFAWMSPAGRAWLAQRDLPEPAVESFRSWWQHRPEPTPAADTKLRPQEAPSQVKQPSVPESRPDLMQLFADRLRELGPGGQSELHVFEHAPEAMAFLRASIEPYEPEDVLVGTEPSQKRDYRLGITEAALLIAQSGGVVLDEPNREAVRASTLVDTHIVVARRDSLVETVQDALRVRHQRRAGGTWNDLQVIVSGPSRTADVEKVLVIPAHGPRRLVVVVCDEPVDLKAVKPVR